MRIITFVFFVFLSACSSNEKRTDELHTSATDVAVVETVAPEPRSDLSYTVRPGDFLSAIAKRTTGNGENWREIAAYNNIKNPNTLSKGDIILIPSVLLKPVEIAAEPKVVISAQEKHVQAPAAVVATPTPPPPELSKIQSDDDNSGWVMVEGSYYPKAVYKEPNYSGGMLTRVLPGTKLKLITTNDNWIGVETDKGLGYLHHSDAHKLSDNELSLNSF